MGLNQLYLKTIYLSKGHIWGDIIHSLTSFQANFPVILRQIRSLLYDCRNQISEMENLPNVSLSHLLPITSILHTIGPPVPRADGHS